MNQWVRGHVRVRVRTMNRERFRIYHAIPGEKTQPEDYPVGVVKFPRGVPPELRPPLKIYSEKKTFGSQARYTRHPPPSTKHENQVAPCYAIRAARYVLHGACWETIDPNTSHQPPSTKHEKRGG